jgi:hypothetical protein
VRGKRRLTTGRHAAIDDVVTRLELAKVRICQRCGRGRAELLGADGASLVVPLDQARARELERPDDADDVPWLSTVVLALLAAGRRELREVVLDAAGHGLQALVTLGRDGKADTDVLACTAQEGVGLAVRAKVPLYATAEALATSAKKKPDAGGHETLH